MTVESNIRHRGALSEPFNIYNGVPQDHHD